MTNEFTITVTASGAEDIERLVYALKIAGLGGANVQQPGKQTMLKKAEPSSPAINKTQPKTSKRGKWLNKGMKETLRSLAKQGISMGDASKKTGVPYGVIYQWQKNPKSNVAFVTGKRGRPRKITNFRD